MAATGCLRGQSMIIHKLPEAFFPDAEQRADDFGAFTIGSERLAWGFVGIDETVGY